MTQGFVTPVTAALTNPVTNDLGFKLKYFVTAFFFKITKWPGPPEYNLLELENEFTYHGSFLN